MYCTNEIKFKLKHFQVLKTKPQAHVNMKRAIGLCGLKMPIIIKRQIIVLLVSCSINVLCLLLTVSWVGLQYVIVIFPDHSHVLIFKLVRVFKWANKGIPLDA